jgi:quercetin dioxygenase-like cupin family protein
MTAQTQNYLFIQNMQQMIEAIQPESIVSRTVYSDAHIKVVLFGFDAGQSLSEHTASQPAIIQILQGEATITLTGDPKEAGAGTWLHMPPNVPHSVVAKTPLIMLLTLLRAKAN